MARVSNLPKGPDGKPLPGKGWPKGKPQKHTVVLKEAILLAAESVGEDNKGKNGLNGYLRRVAMNDMKSFAMLLGKVLPMQIQGGPVKIIIQGKDADL